jgi:hypothetical protein
MMITSVTEQVSVAVTPYDLYSGGSCFETCNRLS